MVGELGREMGLSTIQGFSRFRRQSRHATRQSSDTHLQVLQTVQGITNLFSIFFFLFFLETIYCQIFIISIILFFDFVRC